MKNLHTKFQNDICNRNGGIIVKKNNLKNQNVAFFMPYLREEKSNFHTFISLGRVYNQYLEMRMYLMSVNTLII